MAHPFDRGAVVAGMKPICARVGAACAEQRVARVLVLVDTFACPVVLRPQPVKPMQPAVMPMQSVACAPKAFICCEDSQPVHGAVS